MCASVLNVFAFDFIVVDKQGTEGGHSSLWLELSWISKIGLEWFGPCNKVGVNMFFFYSFLFCVCVVDLLIR